VHYLPICGHIGSFDARGAYSTDTANIVVSKVEAKKPKINNKMEFFCNATK